MGSVAETLAWGGRWGLRGWQGTLLVSVLLPLQLCCNSEKCSLLPCESDVYCMLAAVNRVGAAHCQPYSRPLVGVWGVCLLEPAEAGEVPVPRSCQADG